MSIGMAVVVMVTACWLGAAPAAADGAWLDEPVLASWNSPGQDIPTARPPSGLIDPRCERLHRSAETAEDAAIEAAGWRLFGSYESGWGLRLVHGLVEHDGMCRPVDYQTFAFVDGVFAGTISPVPMNARTDASSTMTSISAPGDLQAQFARYNRADPLCCPSAVSSVQYWIDNTTGTPVLVPGGVFTSPGRP